MRRLICGFDLITDPTTTYDVINIVLVIRVHFFYFFIFLFIIIIISSSSICSLFWCGGGGIFSTENLQKIKQLKSISIQFRISIYFHISQVIVYIVTNCTVNHK